MKSYINTLADYHKAPFEKDIVLHCPKEYIETQMRHLTRKGKKSEAVDIVEKGDIVMLSLQSELEKFNRAMVPLTVGSGLFDAELEEQIIAHKVKETFSVSVQGKSVIVTIQQASRTIFPEPTDEMVVEYAKTHEDFNDVSTVAEYRRLVIRKYLDEEKQKLLYQTMDSISDYVLTHSDWEFDTDEIKEQIQEAKNEIQVELNSEGKQLETLTAEDLSMIFGVTSLAEFDEALKISMERYIASNLWLLQVHQKNSLEEIENMESNPWEFLQNYVEEALNIKEEDTYGDSICDR